MEVGTFLGQTLTVAGVAAGLTQILKAAEEVHPYLRKIPGIGAALAWLVDTITPEDPAAIQIFVALLCFGLNILSTYLRVGSVELDVMALGSTLISFLQANGAYTLILKRFNPPTAPSA